MTVRKEVHLSVKINLERQEMGVAVNDRFTGLLLVYQLCWFVWHSENWERGGLEEALMLPSGPCASS